MLDQQPSLGFFKNIAVSLRAAGPSAVLVSWVIGVTLLGIFGEGEIASKALGALSVVGGLLIIVLGQRS